MEERLEYFAVPRGLPGILHNKLFYGEMDVKTGECAFCGVSVKYSENLNTCISKDIIWCNSVDYLDCSQDCGKKIMFIKKGGYIDPCSALLDS